MPISLPKASLAAHRIPTDERSSRAPGLSRSATRSSWPLPNHLPTTTARSKPTPRLAQHHLRQLRARGSDSGRRRAGHGRSGRPRRPRPSQPYGCLLHRRAPGSHFGRTQRTRQRTNTGRPHRAPTPDTWTLRRPHRTLDIGPVDRQARTPDTGHRTLAEDVDRLTKARPASDLLGHHAERPRAGTPNRVLVDGACGARQPMQARRRGRPPARDSVSPAVAWSLRWGPAAPRRTAVLGRFRVESRARRGPSSVMAVLR
jgi:hypothetical protein